MNAKIYLRIKKVISYFNKISFIIIAFFLIYLSVVIPSFYVPFNNNFYDQINHANIKELKEFSTQLAKWIEIANLNIQSLSSVMVWISFFMLVIIIINNLFLRIKNGNKTKSDITP